MNTKTENHLTVAVFLLMLGLIVFLLSALSQAWRNERFLDAELRKHTTTYNPTNK